MSPSPEELRRIVRVFRPHGWTVIERTRRTSREAGCTYINGKRIIIPELTDLHALFIFFHERAHVIYRHFATTRPRHLEEYQAERSAITWFDAFGFPVSREELGRAKWNVQQMILRDEKKKISVDPLIREWANS